MGKFANAIAGGGALREQTLLPWKGESGFDAMGHYVPAFRRSAAERHLKDMGWDRLGDAEKRYTVVSRMCACIERDNPHEALEFAMREGVDATGCYRLLSVLLTAEDRRDV
jgi:hypothetical protein